jgi:hypothetical protein
MHPAEGGQGGDVESAGQGAAGGSAGIGSMNGGGAGLANGGTGATAGTPSEVLDPDLPVPAHDCRADTENCVSLAGTFDGMAVDVVTDPDQCGGGGVHAGKWAIGCDWLGRASNVHVVLDIPITPPGSFSGSMGPGDAAIGDFQFTATGANTSVALFGDNLVSAEIAGTVVADGSPGTPSRIISGTFHGVWGTPDSSCKGASGTACGTAELNVTFRSHTTFGTCFADAECESPEVCDMVAYYCTSP